MTDPTPTTQPQPQRFSTGEHWISPRGHLYQVGELEADGFVELVPVGTGGTWHRWDAKRTRGWERVGLAVTPPA